MSEPTKRWNVERAALWGLLIGGIPGATLALSRWLNTPPRGEWGAVRQVTMLDDAFYWIGVFATGPILFVVCASILNILGRDSDLAD
jgi:hypothetical protein